MQINIKQLILEGYSYDEITEAVHANHKHLDKSRLKDPTLSYAEGKGIEKNRKALNDDIRDQRSKRDYNRKLVTDLNWADTKREKNQDANYWDNNARARSQTGGKGMVYTKELKDFNSPKASKIMQNVPRVISSAKE